jgi:YcxB-like protein
MNTDACSISFDNLAAEHIAADRLYYQTTAWAKMDKLMALLLVFAGLLLALGVGLRWWTVVPFLLAPLEWFNFFTLRPLVIRYWFKRNPKLQERYDFSFDDDGIHFLTNSIDARIKWDQYTDVLENDRLWLLVYGHRLYSVIPKRAFADSTDVIRFKQLITEHIISREESPS